MFYEFTTTNFDYKWIPTNNLVGRLSTVPWKVINKGQISFGCFKSIWYLVCFFFLSREEAQELLICWMLSPHPLRGGFQTKGSGCWMKSSLWVPSSRDKPRFGAYFARLYIALPILQQVDIAARFLSNNIPFEIDRILPLANPQNRKDEIFGSG